MASGIDIQRRIKYESELDAGFGEKIAGMAYGEKLFSCIQCGTCSATCPVSHYMDYTPRRIIAMVRAGFRDEVLNSVTIWLCASCYSCTVECPREIKITDVMYALKQEAIAAGTYPKRFPIPVLAREFFRGVAANGRNNEGPLMVRLLLRIPWQSGAGCESRSGCACGRAEARAGRCARASGRSGCSSGGRAGSS